MSSESIWEHRFARARKQVGEMTETDKLNIGLSSKGQRIFLDSIAAREAQIPTKRHPAVGHGFDCEEAEEAFRDAQGR